MEIITGIDYFCIKASKSTAKPKSRTQTLYQQAQKEIADTVRNMTAAHRRKYTHTTIPSINLDRNPTNGPTV